MAHTAEAPVVDMADSFLKDYPDLYDAFLWTANPGRLEEVQTSPDAHHDEYVPALTRFQTLSLYMGDRVLSEEVVNGDGERIIHIPDMGDAAKVASKFRDGMRQGYRLGELLTGPVTLAPYVRGVPEPVINEARFSRQIAFAFDDDRKWRERLSSKLSVEDTVHDRTEYICRVVLAPEDRVPGIDGRTLDKVEGSYFDGIEAGLKIGRTLLQTEEVVNG